jgi:hypothetical protein
MGAVGEPGWGIVGQEDLAVADVRLAGVVVGPLPCPLEALAGAVGGSGDGIEDGGTELGQAGGGAVGSGREGRSAAGAGEDRDGEAVDRHEGPSS